MTNFFLDLWQDLRAKRLWPVAVGLLAAIVAVPAMLFKPVSSQPAPTGTTQASTASKLPTVALDASSVTSSHLNVFKEKNPFSVMSDRPVETTATGGGDTALTGTSVAGAGTGAATVGGGATGTTGTGGTTTSGSTPTGGTTGSGTTGPDGKPVTPGVHYYRYSADVRFGARGHTQDYKDIHNLDLLPNGDNPVVAFMGVKDGDTAIFFIADPAFRAEGEGDCVPDPDNCMFVYLKKDEDKNEETLSAQNGQVEYVLELTGLHVETIDKAQLTGDTTPAPKTAAAKRRNKQRATLLSLPSVLAKR